jgi:hypothetical protein
MNESKPSFKFKSWNKKIKNKNTICAQCECNKILLQKHDNNKTRSWKIYVFKTSVEQIKGNVGFYLYLYPLGT